MHVALGTVANKQGRVAGMNLGGRYATFPGVVGTAITKFIDTECARTGLSEREIKALGLQYSTGLIEAYTLPRYYPGSSPICVKVLAEKDSARLLGVQIVGGPGSAKRIDTAATALHAGFSLEDLLYLDLELCPAFRRGVGSDSHRRPHGLKGLVNRNIPASASGDGRYDGIAALKDPIMSYG